MRFRPDLEEVQNWESGIMRSLLAPVPQARPGSGGVGARDGLRRVAFSGVAPHVRPQLNQSQQQQQHQTWMAVAAIPQQQESSSSSGPGLLTRSPPQQNHAPAPAPGTSMPMDVVAVLRSRGLVQEVTSEELGRTSSTTPLSVYCGFDPTADSLHLGNLLGIVVLAWFQRCGHAPVALLGGATGRVGDPSGRSSERPILSEAQIEANVRAIGTTLDSILSRNSSMTPGAPKVQVVNNLDWFGTMSLLSFLRDVGKYARVGTMLAKDSVKSRMEAEAGISFTEFSYQLLQGYDFVHLHRQLGVRVQVGGSDQWGNITAGTDLIRRLGPGAEDDAAPEAGSPLPSPDQLPASSSTCFGLTFPLLVDSEGKKFGKSVGGAIWLSAERLSPYKFYQYLFAVADADVIKFLKMLTFLDLGEIEGLEAGMGAEGYVPNSVQRRLAEEVTRFVHGEEGLQQALRATEALKPGSTTQLDATTLEAVAGDAPSASLNKDQVLGLPLVDLMVSVGLQPSKAQGRKLIKGGGVYLNNLKVGEELRLVKEEDLIDGRMLLVAAGKKNKMLVKLQ